MARAPRARAYLIWAWFGLLRPKLTNFSNKNSVVNWISLLSYLRRLLARFCLFFWLCVACSRSKLWRNAGVDSSTSLWWFARWFTRAYPCSLCSVLCFCAGSEILTPLSRFAWFAQLCEPGISVKIVFVRPKLTKFSITGDSFVKLKLSMIFLEASPRGIFEIFLATPQLHRTFQPTRF